MRQAASSRAAETSFELLGPSVLRKREQTQAANGDEWGTLQGAVETLGDRVETLSAIVRETTGRVAARDGEVALFEERLERRLRESTTSVASALAELRKDVERVRHGGSSTPLSGRAQEALVDEIQTVTQRLDTLSGIVSATASRVAASEGELSSLRATLAGAGPEFDDALDELRRDVQSLAERVERESHHAVPAPSPPVADHTVEERLSGHVATLADRIETLSGTVNATAGRVTAKEGELVHLRESVQAGEERVRGLVGSLGREIEAIRARLVEDPTLRERVDGLSNSVTTLADRIQTISGIVRQTAGSTAAPDGDVSAFGGRLGELEERIDDLRSELHDVVVALQGEDRMGDAGRAQLEQLRATVDTATTQLARLEQAIAAAGALEAPAELRSELSALTDRVVAGEQHVLELVGSLGREMEELSTRVASDPELHGHVEGLSESMAGLGERIDAIATIVQQTAGSAPVSDGEISVFGGRLAELEQRLDVVAVELRRVMDAVASADGDDAERRAGLDSLRATVAATTAHLARLEEIVAGATHESPLELQTELGALADRIDRVDRDRATTTADIARRIDELEERRAAEADQAWHTQYSWSQRHEAVQRRLDELAAAVETAGAEGSGVSESALHGILARLEQMERESVEMTRELERAERSWTTERALIEARLGEIVHAASGSPGAGGDVQLLVGELAERLERVEQLSTGELAKAASAWAAERSAMEARVEEIATALATWQPAAGQTDPQLTRALEELSLRVEDIERHRDEVAAELARASQTWVADRTAIKERVAELAARIVTGPVPAQADAPEGQPSAVAEQELDRLRIAVEGMRMRLAYHEKTVAEMSGKRSVADRLDELDRRLDQLQGAVAVNAGSGVFTPQAPQGELSQLMQRMEVAERSVRSDQDTVLAQLERIASRLDWRLHRLETVEHERAAVPADAD